MSEHRKVIILGGILAVVLGASLGVATLVLPAQIGGALGAHSSNTADHTTMNSTIMVTSTGTTASTTGALPTIVTSPSVELDASLNVSLAQSSLVLTNATRIAQEFASALGQSLVGVPNVTSGYESTYYKFETGSSSTILVGFAQGIQVTYEVQNLEANENETTINPNFNASKADQLSLEIMNSVGIPVSSMNLTSTLSSLSPSDYQIQWVQSYRDIQLLGPLTENQGGGSYFFATSEAYFDFDPSTIQLKEATFVGSYWYVIPSTFPLNVSAGNAANLALDYAIQKLGVNQVSGTSVSFAVVDGSLYYVVIVSNAASTYEIFVDPRNGQVGFPM